MSQEQPAKPDFTIDFSILFEDQAKSDDSLNKPVFDLLFKFLHANINKITRIEPNKIYNFNEKRIQFVQKLVKRPSKKYHFGFKFFLFSPTPAGKGLDANVYVMLGVIFFEKTNNGFNLCFKSKNKYVYKEFKLDKSQDDVELAIVKIKTKIHQESLYTSQIKYLLHKEDISGRGFFQSNIPQIDFRKYLCLSGTERVLVPIYAIVSRLLFNLRYFRFLGFAHLDAKPENIRVDPPCGVFFIDLGMARLIGQELNEPCGTLGYVAPEMFTGKYFVSEKLDVFSLGSLILDILIAHCNLESPEFSVYSHYEMQEKYLNLDERFYNFNQLPVCENMDAKKEFMVNLFYIEKKIKILEKKFLAPFSGESPESALLKLALKMLQPDPDARPTLDVCIHSLIKISSIARRFFEMDEPLKNYLVCELDKLEKHNGSIFYSITNYIKNVFPKETFGVLKKKLGEEKPLIHTFLIEIEGIISKISNFDSRNDKLLNSLKIIVEKIFAYKLDYLQGDLIPRENKKFNESHSI